METARATTRARARALEADRGTFPRRTAYDGPVIDMTPDDFDDLVDEVFDTLPDDIVGDLDNVAIVVEDRPEDGSLDLLGLYHGVALTERDQYGFGELPDTISIYREPLLHHVDDEAALRAEVRVTLVHEIGHYFGLDDAELHRLGWG